MVCGGDNTNDTEWLHTTIASSSQRDAPYQVSVLQAPLTLFSAQTPSMHPKACIRIEKHVHHVDMKQIKNGKQLRKETNNY